jgi:hypothetical protein
VCVSVGMSKRNAYVRKSICACTRTHTLHIHTFAQTNAYRRVDPGICLLLCGHGISGDHGVWHDGVDEGAHEHAGRPVLGEIANGVIREFSLCMRVWVDT